MRSSEAGFGRIVSGAIGSGLAVLVVLIGLPGCGNVGGIPVDETATRIANTICPKAWMCCTADQLMSNSAAGTTEQDCITQTTSSYQNQLSTLQSSIDQKRASYQSSKLDTCLMTIKDSDCTALDVTNHVAGIPGCESFTTPLVAVGGACSQDYECINGWCNVPSSSNNGEGTCADDLQCTSLNCSSSGGSGMTCQAATTPPAAMCFYSSGCSAAGGRPGAGTLLLFAGFAAIAFLRAGRARRNR